MFLISSNWSLNNCILYGVHEPNDKSLLGGIYTLPPLDIVFGDILSFSMRPDEEKKMVIEFNDMWFNANLNYSHYANIYSASEYINPDDSWDIMDVIKEFIRATSTDETRMTLSYLEIFLACCRCREPVPEKRIVTKGFWGKKNELKEDVIATQEIFCSLGKDTFFSCWDKYSKSVDLACVFEVNNFADIALVAIYLILKNGKALFPCIKCGRLFSPSRKGELYCGRYTLGTVSKTCKEEAKYQKQLVRERASGSGKVYKSIHNMLYALYVSARDSASPNAEDLWNRLESFRKTAQAFRDDIRVKSKQGISTQEVEAEYMNFLNSYYKRKGKENNNHL